VMHSCAVRRHSPRPRTGSSPGACSEPCGNGIPYARG
jgi:hypothetical protein